MYLVDQPLNHSLSCSNYLIALLFIILFAPVLSPSLPTHPTTPYNPHFELTQDGDGRTAFYKAIQKGHAAVVELLLKEDQVDVNQPNNFNGVTPICMRRCHAWSRRGHGTAG